MGSSVCPHSQLGPAWIWVRIIRKQFSWSSAACGGLWGFPWDRGGASDQTSIGTPTLQTDIKQDEGADERRLLKSPSLDV